MITTVLVFLLVIIVLVVVHEFGHFWVAKKLGVRVDEFGVGYPPRARTLFFWKGTRFTLNWLPFGGFVRIFGEQETEVLETGSFIQQPLWKRLSIILAGIVANLLFAILLYAGIFATGFPGTTASYPRATVLEEPRVLVAEVLSGSRAQEAGIVSGDVITKMAGETVASVDDVIASIEEHEGEPLLISILRDGTEETITTYPTDDPLGVALAETGSIRLPFFSALLEAMRQTGIVFVSIFETLGRMIGGDASIVSQLAGPVGIAQIATGAYELGIAPFLAFMALISINLAAINLLPFPALDGGRFVLEFFVRKGKSSIPNRVVMAINQVGFLILILLMLYVTYKDIGRI